MSRKPKNIASTFALLLAFVVSVSGQSSPTAIAPGTRVLLDAHNAYPYNGQWADRLDRALSTGVPLAIEQDLVWRPGTNGGEGRSIVSHGEPYDGKEPMLREHFFERIRPLVEAALEDGDRTRWPLVTLNLDLKSNEPEHHRAIWMLLGEYESWLTTALRTADGTTPAPLVVGPVLVLTGDSDLQAKAFHDDIPVGAKLRLFGAVVLRPPTGENLTREQALAHLGAVLRANGLPRATNYRRWWNAPWAIVESGGQVSAGDWTTEEDAHLRALVRRAHESGLWVRLWTLNGHSPGDDKASGWTASYNLGSRDAAIRRWTAAIAARADFVATDQYEAFRSVLAASTRQP